MSVQILLPLHTYPDGNSEELTRHAASVAAYLEGEIDALVLHVEFPQVSSILGNLVVDVPSILAGARERCRKKGVELLDALKHETAAREVRLRSSEVDCHPAALGNRLAVASRYHDLVLTGLTPGDDTLRSTAEAVVFGSGRPVMLLPDQPVTTAWDHVMIAWDGSRVAARAVSDARLFLQRAAKVTVAIVVDEKTLEQDLASRMVGYLAAGGLNAEAVEIHRADRPISVALQDEAARAGCGLLVMGGFGHSRMRDFVLGGATRGILEDLRMPALLSH